MTEGPSVIQIQHDSPDLARLTTEEVPGAAMAVAISVTPTVSEEAPRSCLYLTTLIELFARDQTPAQAVCSLLAMCWFWPSGCEAKEKDLFLGSALLSLVRLLKDKLACLARDIAACLTCRSNTKGDKQPVIMSCETFLFVSQCELSHSHNLTFIFFL